MSEQTKLDLSKPVQTRDGRPVRVLCTDAMGHFCIVGLIEREGYATDHMARWTEEGMSEYGLSEYNLINTPPRRVKREGWVNIVEHKGYDGTLENRIVRNAAIWPTEARALQEAKEMGDVIATVRLEPWEEDEQP